MPFGLAISSDILNMLCLLKFVAKGAAKVLCLQPPVFGFPVSVKWFAFGKHAICPDSTDNRLMILIQLITDLWS